MNSLQGEELKNKIDAFYDEISELSYSERADAIIGDLHIIAYHDEELDDMFRFVVRTSDNDELLFDTGDVYSDVLYDVLYNVAECGTDLDKVKETTVGNYIAYANEEYEKSFEQSMREE